MIRKGIRKQGEGNVCVGKGVAEGDNTRAGLNCPPPKPNSALEKLHSCNAWKCRSGSLGLMHLPLGPCHPGPAGAAPHPPCSCAEPCQRCRELAEPWQLRHSWVVIPGRPGHAVP